MSDSSGFLNAVCVTNGGQRCAESIQNTLSHCSGQQGTPGTSSLAGPSRGSLAHECAVSTAESKPQLLGVNGFTLKSSLTHASAPSDLVLPRRVLPGIVSTAATPCVACVHLRQARPTPTLQRTTPALCFSWTGTHSRPAPTSREPAPAILINSHTAMPLHTTHSPASQAPAPDGPITSFTEARAPSCGTNAVTLPALPRSRDAAASALTKHSCP